MDSDKYAYVSYVVGKANLSNVDRKSVHTVPTIKYLNAQAKSRTW